MNIPKPDMFKEAESARVKNIFLQIIIFYAVFLVISIAESIVPSVMMIPELMDYIMSDEFTGVNQKYMNFVMEVQARPSNMLATLFSTVFGTVLSIIYCRFIEKRSLGSMGMRKKKAVSSYLAGMLVGFVMFSGVVLLNVISGAVRIEGINPDLNIGLFLIYLCAWLVQGMSEEFIFRGFLMNSIGGKHNMIFAVLISAGAFSLAHILNPGATPLGLFNIFLFGVFMSVYMICFDNIWGVSAIHSLWNFSQGNLFGISVSGTGSGETLFITSPSESKALFHGGAFGAEGGISATVILFIAFIILFLYMFKAKKNDRQ